VQPANVVAPDAVEEGGFFRSMRDGIRLFFKSDRPLGSEAPHGLPEFTRGVPRAAVAQPDVE